MSVRLGPHLTLPHRLGDGLTSGLLYHDASNNTLRLATTTELETALYADTYWDDLLVPLTATKVGANSLPHYDYTNVAYLFPNGATDEILYFTAQFPHRYKVGTAVYPHIHWIQAADQTPVFKLNWKWTSIGAIIDDYNTYTMSTNAMPYTSGNIHQISKNATGIAGDGKGISSMMQCQLYRDDTAYTGDCAVWQIDFHFEIDLPGSREEYIK